MEFFVAAVRNASFNRYEVHVAVFELPSTFSLAVTEASIFILPLTDGLHIPQAVVLLLTM